MLRADGAASGIECSGVADESDSEGRQIYFEWHESVDHKWRRGGRGDCLREYRTGERVKKELPRWWWNVARRDLPLAKKKRNWGLMRRHAWNFRSRIAKCRWRTESEWKAKDIRSRFQR